MPLRPFYKITDNELYHLINDGDDGLRSIQLFFFDEGIYNESAEKIQAEFETELEGIVNLNGTQVYKLVVNELIQGEGNVEHGYFSFIYAENYIRVYWNNNKKEVIFHRVI